MKPGCILFLLFLLPFPLHSGQNTEQVAKAAKLVAKSAGTYIEKRDCISCHHQSLPMWALGKAGIQWDATSQTNTSKNISKGVWSVLVRAKA